MHMNRYLISHEQNYYVGTLTRIIKFVKAYKLNIYLGNYHCMRLWMVAWPKRTLDLRSTDTQRSIEENYPDGVKTKERDPYKQKRTQIGLT